MILRTASCKEIEVWKLLKLSTVIRTSKELIETITDNVTSWTKFLEGLLLHASEFLLHFANVILHML